MNNLLAGGVVAGMLFSAACAVAQDDGSEAFSRHCRQALSDIQADRQVCVIGVVETDKTVRVLFSTNASLPGKTVAIFKTKVQQGAMYPLDDLASMRDRVIAVGGFSNGNDIFSARRL